MMKSSSLPTGFSELDECVAALDEMMRSTMSKSSSLSTGIAVLHLLDDDLHCTFAFAFRIE